MNDDLPTDFWVSAQIRIAAQSGVPIVLIHKGDPSSGTVLLKINRLDGTNIVLSQIRLDEERVWSPVSDKPTLSDSEADAYLARQVDFDPDVWVLEIEDKQGRCWFPGRVLSPTERLA